MKNKYIFYLVIAIISLLALVHLSAQSKARQWNTYAENAHFSNNEGQNDDTLKGKINVVHASLKPGSKEYIDSMKLARQLYVDSMKSAQKAFQDSLRKAREYLADSTATAIKNYNDSLKAAMDIARAERQRVTDSMKSIQQARKDSLDQLRAYRASKVFKDSVENRRQDWLDSIASVRKQRADSLVQVRLKMKDSLATVRQKMQDSLTQQREKLQDSIASARKQYQDSIAIVIADQKAKNLALKDSIATVRAIRTDSLAKAKVEREALALKRQSDRNKAKNAKGREAEKKKREAYSNEDMLKKKWTLLRKVFNNTTTRYNYYFNAKERLAKVEENMRKNEVNKYDSLLPLYAFDPDVDSSKYAPDLDSLIRKASVGIQIHDPRSKWQDNLYFVVGKSYFYKGDYKNAAAAFKYIVATAESQKKEKAKNKDKKAIKNLGELADPATSNLFLHETSKNNAILWLARTLAQDSQRSLAQTLLNMLRSSENYDSGLDGRFASVQSFINLKNQAYGSTIESLSPLIADKTSPDNLRQRAAFLKGQLLQKEHRYLASDSAFDQVIALHPELEMDFSARMNKVNNSIDGGFEDTKGMLASLNRMSRETKYKNYFDRIYFAQAQVYKANKDTANAIEQFKKSLAANTKNTVQRGLSYAGMGDIYYAANQYNESKNLYDSAIAFLTPAQDPVFSIATQRAGALSYIADPGNIVRYTDSILALSKRTEKEQLTVIRKEIKEQEKHAIDSFYAAKNSTVAPALASPQTLGGGKQSWYFGNPSTVQQGSTSFKQKWGSRSLKDNWNRSDLSSNASSNSGALAANTELSEEDQLRAALPTEEQLLARIPKTTKEVDSANKLLENALYELGLGYYKHMDDQPMSIKTFDDLDRRFPAHDHHAEIVYYRYLMALNKNEKTAADSYLAQLMKDYPNSDWAKMVNAAEKNTLEGSKDSLMPMAQHYEEAYNALMAQNYMKVYRDAEAAPALYPKEIAPLENKYQLLKYAAIAGEKNYAEADSLLSLYIIQHQGDETIGWATELRKYVRNQINKPPNSAFAPTKFNTIAGDTAFTKYTFMPNNLHYVIITADKAVKQLNKLRFELLDYNKGKAANKKLEVSIVPLNAIRTIVVVQEFKNEVDANKYILEIKAVKALFSDFPDPAGLEILSISNDNIIKLYTDMDWEAYSTFYRSQY